MIIHEMKIPDHKHDTDGYGVYILNDNSTVPINEETKASYKKEICGASVTCSICGLAACNDMFEIWGGV